MNFLSKKIQISPLFSGSSFGYGDILILRIAIFFKTSLLEYNCFTMTIFNHHSPFDQNIY